MKLFLMSIIFFLLPSVSSAAGFVTCTGADCDLCDLILMINTIIDWLTMLSMTIATILFAYAGFKLTSSAGNSGAVSQAKEMMVNVVIGVIIILAAFTIIDTVMKVLINDDFGPWNKPAGDCGALFTPGEVKSFSVKVDEEVLIAEHEDQASIINGDSDPTVLTAASVTRGSYSRPGVGGVPQKPGQLCFSGTGGVPTCIPYAPTKDNDRVPAVIDAKLYGGLWISKNYTVDDLNRSNTCGRGGDLWYIDPEAVERLEIVTEKIGQKLSVNSGYRSPSCNTKVGGATDSRHMYGLAFDIQPPGGKSNRQQVINACCAAGAGYVAIYNSTSHVHCDFRSTKAGSSLCK